MRVNGQRRKWSIVNSGFWVFAIYHLLFTPSAVYATVTLPIEVMGPVGSSQTVTVTLPPGTASTVDHLYLQLHNAGYLASYQAANNLSDKASVQINGGTPIPLDNTTVTLYPHDLALGGIGGGHSTVRGTIPITLTSDTVTLTFIFNVSDGVSSGFRVLAFNFISGGANVLPASTFVNNDPSAWTVPFEAAASSNVTNGQQLWQNASLVDSPLPGAAMIGARCMDCHVRDGGDLKYFNYSNYSIHARAMFHGLSDQDGWDIAAYIRTLNNYQSKNGRPWNPVYQPGAVNGVRLDSLPVQEWSAGAGVSAVLDNDSQMLPYLFPGGQIKDNNIVNPKGELNARETPIPVQLLDWNRWLPRIHPMDSWPSAWVSKGVQQAFLNVRSYLQSAGPPSPSMFSGFFFGTYTSYETAFANFINQFDQGPYTSDQQANQVLSAHQWNMVKQWEMMNEFNLQQVAANTGSVNPAYTEPRGWFQADAFNAAPFINHIGTAGGPSGNNSDTPQHSSLLTDYQNDAWYQLQFILTTNRWNGDNRPIDFGYNGPTFAQFAAETFPQPARRLYFLIRGGQLSTNGWGPEFSPYGWRPQSKMDVSFLAHPIPQASPLSAMLGNQMTQAQWVSAATVMLQDWLARNKEYQPQEYYTTTSFFASVIGNPNYIPNGAQFQSREPADQWWTMIPIFRVDGIDEKTINDLLDWFQTVYPKAPWDLLRASSVTDAPSSQLWSFSPGIDQNGNIITAAAPAQVDLGVQPFTFLNHTPLPVSKIEIWVNDAIKIGETDTTTSGGYYHFLWTNVPAGTYQVSARIYLPGGSAPYSTGDRTWVVTGGTPAPGPTITSFTASAGTINSGQSTTLSWQTLGATAVDIEPGPGPQSQVDSGSISVSPILPMTYTLTAASFFGTTTQTLSVNVNMVPSGIQLLPQSAFVNPGGPCSWAPWWSTRWVIRSGSRVSPTVSPGAPPGTERLTPTEISLQALLRVLRRCRPRRMV